MTLHSFDADAMSDPIAKGRLVAELQASEYVIVVGFEAGSWVARELEGVPVYFAGGLPELRGTDLKKENWSGSMPYNAEQVLEFASAVGWKSIGVAYSPGYEALLPQIRSAAAARSVRISETRAGTLPQVRALSDLLDTTDALWLLGDPLLMRGAGFSFLLVRSLAAQRALIAPNPALVGQGAFVAFTPDWKGIMKRAAALASSGPSPAQKLDFAPAGGAPLINEVLSRKWKITIPKNTR